MTSQQKLPLSVRSHNFTIVDPSNQPKLTLWHISCSFQAAHRGVMSNDVNARLITLTGSIKIMEDHPLHSRYARARPVITYFLTTTNRFGLHKVLISRTDSLGPPNLLSNYSPLDGSAGKLERVREDLCIGISI